MKAKKIMAGAFAFALTLSAMSSVLASAADATVTLRASDETVSRAGESFTVSVYLEDVPSTKVNTLDFAINYDTSILTIDSVAIGAAANTDTSGDTTASDAPVFAYNIDGGEIAISWSTGLGESAWISSDGVILTLSGKVNNGVAGGTKTSIDFAPVSRETYQGSGTQNSTILVGAVNGSDVTSYNVKTTSGSVTVSSTQSGGGSSSGGSSSSTTASLIGDVTCDGEVDVADAVLLAKYASGLISFTDEQVANAECYQDGVIDQKDTIALLKYTVNEVTSLPVK